MSDTYTEHIGYGSRVSNGFKGVITGIILIIIGIGLLWWNEGRTIRQTRALNEVKENVVSVSSDTLAVENNNKLIHTQGKAHTEKGISDRIFRITTDGIGIKRTVLMYQWKETSETNSNGDTKTYTYSKVWSEDPISSSSFKRSGYENPSMTYESDIIPATDVTLGAFSLSPDQVKKIYQYEFIELDEETIRAFPSKLQGGSIEGDLYYSGSISDPQIGDYKIQFEEIPNDTDTSVIGVQNQKNISAYVAKNGNQIEIVYAGIHTSDNLIQKEHEKNKILAWILRGIGLLLLGFGFTGLLGPIQAILSFIPFLGSGVAYLTRGIGFLIGGCLGIIVIAVAWIAYRPFLGIGLLVLVGIILFLIFKKKQEKPTTQTETIIS